MKLHILTIGAPRLPFAADGWRMYAARLQHYHRLRVTHLADKYAEDDHRILQAAGKTFKVALTVEGVQFSSSELASFLNGHAQLGTEICFIIGGPDGLPDTVRQQADVQWSLSMLTFPHDLAMVITAEALYRASTILAGHPYHK